MPCPPRDNLPSVLFADDSLFRQAAPGYFPAGSQARQVAAPMIAITATSGRK